MQKIRHKHTLARNHFSKLSTMANYFRGGHGGHDNDKNELNDANENKIEEIDDIEQESSPLPLSSASISVSASLTN